MQFYFKKNNKKTRIWNILGEIIKIYSAGSYAIKILNDENKFFKSGEEYYINFTLLKKLDDKIWQKLNRDFQDSLDKHLVEIYGNDKVNNDEYDYSSVDDSEISESDFEISENEELISENIKEKRKLYVKKKYNINLLV